MRSPIFRYYAQNGEDYILWKFFNYKQTGFFVDIGAFDGVHLSNTYSFEQQGWQGVCIEPSPYYFERCQQNRKNSCCLNMACVGDQEINEVDFNTEKTGLLSSLSGTEEWETDVHNTYQHFALPDVETERIKVPAMTLNAILEQHLPQDTGIDFISIDVEGAEMEILQGFDLLTYLPRVVILEANTQKDKERLEHYMTKLNGYSLAKEFGINLFFVRDQEDVKRFQSIEVNCVIEKQLHPLGEKYTQKDFIQGKVMGLNSRTIKAENLLQQKDQKLQQKTQELQQKNQEFQQKNQELQQKNQELQQKTQELQQKTQELQQKDEYIRQILTSPTYRFGHVMLFPFKMIRILLQKKEGHGTL